MKNICILIVAIMLMVAPIQGQTKDLKDKAPSTGVAKGKIINIGGEKQLFIDDLFFETARDVKLKLNPALKTGEKNLQREKPWESADINWFTVIKDGDKFCMWYECYDLAGWDAPDDTAFCYATSTDGIKWTRPNLGLFEYQGGKNNNILFRLIGATPQQHEVAREKNIKDNDPAFRSICPPNNHSRVHGTGVFIDPAAPPEQRYKGVSQGLWWQRKLTPPLAPSAHRIAGMYSPDGIHWTRYQEPICDIMADSQYSCFWDQSLGKYVLYGRYIPGTDRGRSLGRSESKDFTNFAPLSLVLKSDDNDPQPCDMYNPAAIKYPYAANAYFMFISLFQHTPQTLDIHLAVSRDGIHWTRPDQKIPFIPLGKKGEFDSGSLYIGQGLIKVGNELWQYYGGSPLTHAESEPDKLKIQGNGRIFSRVVSRLDGYVSVEAGPQGGDFVTPLLNYSGNTLMLNVKVRPGGEVRVGLQDASGQPIAGRTVEDCQPITGDDVDIQVRWKTDGGLAELSGKPVKLNIKIKDADLFAFQFTEIDKTGPQKSQK